MSTPRTCPHGQPLPADLTGTLACPVCAATLALTPAATTAERPAVPGYEIESELSRGGMGVVYRARHLALNRPVALKMILAGAHAGPAELARFRGEAEAVARLQHPYVVQIYDVGEADGLPYLTLELVAGGSLDRKLAGTPLPPQEAAALLEKLAQALAAAHDKGVVHRDLKPANVLLAEPASGEEALEGTRTRSSLGTPKVSDFGLAKRLDAAGQTATGSVLGTPSYMAPEQAEGRSRDIGPATDVYALGAILYECLTGRPPFRAATLLETLQQVISDEPVPPRLINPQVPVDLETVCLKCLHKELHRRYAGALDLAEDLQRFGKGEPVRARPVGPAERARKWVRRNPALAGALAGVGLALLLSLVVSTVFAVEASRQAAKARDKEADAVAKGEALAEANTNLTRTTDDLTRSRDDLQRSRDSLEAAVARSLIRPLGAQGGGRSISEPEWEALWQLATDRSERLGYRFVEEATRGPVSSRQLRDRAALALHAAVGLDSKRRAAVEALLLARLEDPAVPDGQKTDLALAAAAWGDVSPPAALRLARQLSGAATRARDPQALRMQAEGLAALAARLRPRDACAVCAPVATAFSQALKKLEYPQNLSASSQLVQDLLQGLRAVAAHLESRDAAVIAGDLSQALKDTKDWRSWRTRDLAHALSVVVGRLEPSAAAAVCAPAAAALSQAAKDNKDPEAWWPLAVGLRMVAGHLESKDAALAAAALLQALKDNKDRDARLRLVLGLRAVAARMEAKDVAAALLQALEDTKAPRVWGALAQGLAERASRLGPREASVVCAPAAAALLQVLEDTKEPEGWLTFGLSGMAAHLQGEDAARAAAALFRAIKDNKNPTAVQALAWTLPALAAHLEPRDAAVIAGALFRAIKDSKDPGGWQSLEQGLVAVVARVGARDAAAIAADLSQALKDNKVPFASQPLVQALSALAPRLEARDAAMIATDLSQALKENKDWHTRRPRDLAEGLSAVAGRLGRKEAGVVCAPAAAALSRAIQDNKDPGAWGALTEGLAALAARLDPSDAAMVCAPAIAALIRAIMDNKNHLALAGLAKALSTVAGCLEPKAAAVVCAQAASVLSQALKDTKDSNAWEWLVLGLSALAERMGPQNPALTAALSQALKVNKKSYAWRALGQDPLPLAACLETKDAAVAAAALTQALTETTALDQGTRTQGLSALLTGVPSELALRSGGLSAALSSLGGPGQPLAALALLGPAAAPLPCRLSTPQLVELLKQPACIGPARRLVLDHLGNRYQRPFADVWDFVRFAHQQQLGLDFTSPPQRPW